MDEELGRWNLLCFKEKKLSCEADGDSRDLLLVTEKLNIAFKASSKLKESIRKL
jgi:hypothetical protein